MTDDTNGDRELNCSVTGSQANAGAWTRAEWESLRTDPDLQSDLEYELSEWEQFETLDGTDQVMFLPTDEEDLKDAAFVVAEKEQHLELANHC